MSINCIDVVSSAMRAVNLSLKNISSITVKELPSIHKKELFAVRILSGDDTFTSIMVLGNKKQSAGVKIVMVVYIANCDIKNLFASLGLNDKSSETELRDACGEFCNILAGSFKTEIVALGLQDIEMSLPRSYYGAIEEYIQMETTFKYTLGISNEDNPLLTLDVFWQNL